MPRKPREFVDGGIYHVFNRGNNRGSLFKSKDDFSLFYSLLSSVVKKFEITIFHYCLMTNHFHVLLRSGVKDALPDSMHWLQLGYARHFKLKYQTTGHIFEERFRSPRIAEESYYLQCGRYIERNPVTAKMVPHPWNYPYSSAAYYAAGKPSEILTPNLYYLQMGNDDFERRENYRKFLLMDDPYAPMIQSQLLKY